MHMVIRALVYAKDKKGAIEQARHVFERMCGEGLQFDYYTMFGKENEGSVVSGPDRWGHLPECELATSKKGKKLVDEGWEATSQEFKRHFEEVKKGMELFTADELLETEYVESKADDISPEEKEKRSIRSMFRYYCNCMGAYRGHSIWLYDNDGEGITTKRHLNDVLSKWEGRGGASKEYKDKKVWVVPADVHH